MADDVGTLHYIWAAFYSSSLNPFLFLYLLQKGQTCYISYLFQTFVVFKTYLVEQRHDDMVPVRFYVQL